MSQLEKRLDSVGPPVLGRRTNTDWNRAMSNCPHKATKIINNTAPFCVKTTCQKPEPRFTAWQQRMWNALLNVLASWLTHAGMHCCRDWDQLHERRFRQKVESAQRTNPRWWLCYKRLFGKHASRHSAQARCSQKRPLAFFNAVVCEFPKHLTVLCTC
jgi:hypothetical protein